MTYGDYRALLGRNDIDAAIVATWDHMHSRVTCDACRAGTDAFVEKPMTSLPMQDLLKRFHNSLYGYMHRPRLLLHV